MMAVTGIPAFEEAEDDPRLRGVPLRTHRRLRRHLDLKDLREAKTLWLARELRCSERTVQRALNRLVECGYLEKGPIEPTKPRTYRLLISRKTGRE